MTMAVTLIPAYEPDARLVALIVALVRQDPSAPVVVVDDGSGPAYREVFEAARVAGAEILIGDVNRGKGHALRRGLAYIEEQHPGQDVVCADCDGQHTPEDIARIADAVEGGVGRIVLGCRSLAVDVPLRSRFGNTVTRHVFALATGRMIHDTQTGLRGYSAQVLPWLQTVPGDRFEYELEILLRAQRQDIQMTEVPIATIYEENHSSHFRTFRDSARVYLPFLKFSLSSIAAFAVDVAAFFALMALTGNLLIAVVLARATSATVNFTTNRRLIFAPSGTRAGAEARRYATLVLSLLAANYLLILSLTSLGIVVGVAKFATEALLFGLSYQLQRRVVFRPGSASREPGRPTFEEGRDSLLEVGRGHQLRAHGRDGCDGGGLALVERESSVGDGVAKRRG